MKPNLMKKTQPRVSKSDEPINLLNVSDELGHINSFIECAILAIPEGCSDIQTAGAIQTVLMRGQELLEAVVDKIDAERERQSRVEEANQTKAA